ncbi:MAG TPA: DUF2695 domain-containing protein [Gemmataceae bacterium]|nr:DUF2695 domain-containing protein [Gemmataceae bacterium]
MDVMQSEHPRWEEFVERTTMAIAGSVTGIDVDAALRGCNGHRLGGALFESAWAVLAYMDMDVERSIEFFEAHGGFCDCEVMLNIAAADDDVPPWTSNDGGGDVSVRVPVVALAVSLLPGHLPRH